jgi:hypothetical protein
MSENVFPLVIVGVLVGADMTLGTNMTTVKIHKILANVKHPEMENKNIKAI